jgi:acetyltransferase-like isoleucine patch superfamily enzyme
LLLASAALRIDYIRYCFHPHIAVKKIIGRWIGIPFSKWFINFLFQRIFRLNAEIPFQVNFSSTVIIGKGISIGKNVWKSFALSGGCYIQGGNGIFIGDNTIFAPGVKIVSANHDPNNNMGWSTSQPIRIGCRCWIGANAVILPGVELGDDIIVGAGAVVTKSYPVGKVTIAGSPAKEI